MLFQRWDHPAVWRCRDLESRQDWQIEFDPESLRELKDLMEEDESGAQEIESLSAVDDVYPNLLRMMLQIREDLESGTGIVRLAGFPSEKVESDRAVVAFWRMLNAIGTPVAQTAEGRRLFRVQDERLAANHPAARGPSSSRRLSFHTDRCDVIGFLCVRQAISGGDNLVVSSMSVFNRLFDERPDLLETLCQPFFYQRHNVDAGNQHRFYAQPVFTERDGYFAASLLRVLIERAYQDPQIGPMSDQQRQALDFLEEVAEDPLLHVRFRQRPGEILLLNNHVTMHRRDAFDDESAASGRLLWRLWLAVPNSRPLHECYGASYGDTSPGAVRGGMRFRAAND